MQGGNGLRRTARHHRGNFQPFAAFGLLRLFGLVPALLALPLLDPGAQLFDLLGKGGQHLGRGARIDGRHFAPAQFQFLQGLAKGQQFIHFLQPLPVEPHVGDFLG